MKPHHSLIPQCMLLKNKDGSIRQSSNQQVSIDPHLVSRLWFRFCRLSSQCPVGSRIWFRTVHCISLHVSLSLLNLEQFLSLSSSLMTLMFLESSGKLLGMFHAIRISSRPSDLTALRKIDTRISKHTLLPNFLSLYRKESWVHTMVFILELLTVKKPLTVRSLAPVVLSVFALPSLLLEPVSWPPWLNYWPRPLRNTPAAVANFWVLTRGRGPIRLS